MRPGVHFPEPCFWGAATSAHQVEGGNRWNDWWRFEQEPGVIHGGDASGRACDHYARFDQDFALAENDGHNAHRFSIEWSRIEPEPGKIAPDAVAHYHEVLASLKRRGLEPLVTLHHFTNPQWIAERGGWERHETIEAFLGFVRFCAREYGGEVDWWCTVNEPEVYAFRGWSEGIWPPRKRDNGAALAVIANLLEAHAGAYRILHEEDRTDADGDGHAARVGFAKHCPQLEPLRPWFPLDTLRARLEDAVFNQAVFEAPLTGEIRLAIPGARSVRRRVEGLQNSQDWVGLNYYTRWMVCATGSEPHVARRGAPLTDLKWEIHPPGLAQAARRAARAGLPVIVTEHGFADAADAFRPRALVESLLHLGRAVQDGLPLRGYFHWSLLDNFEWSDGFGPRFGLYHVDYANGCARRRTRSADLYARIIAEGGIDPALLEEVGLAALD